MAITNSTASPTGRKVRYLNNRDLLAEIHKSKNTYSSFTKPEYSQHDIILTSLDLYKRQKSISVQ